MVLINNLTFLDLSAHILGQHAFKNRGNKYLLRQFLKTLNPKKKGVLKGETSLQIFFFKKIMSVLEIKHETSN